MLILNAYVKDESLCIVKTDRTKDFRNMEQLLISIEKPHGTVSKGTVSRWIKRVLEKAGIDSTFKPHSKRAAVTSKAKLARIL